MSEPTSVTEGGVTITSNAETKEQISEALKPATAETEPSTETPAATPEELSESAAKLGKKGGEVAAAKRAEAKEAQAETPPDPDDEPDEDPAPEGKKHPRSDPKSRINVLVREREEARREAARLAAELERVAKPEPAKPAPIPDKGRPQSQDFENYEDFVEAVSDWKANLTKPRGSSANAPISSASSSSTVSFLATVAIRTAIRLDFQPLPRRLPQSKWPDQSESGQGCARNTCRSRSQGTPCKRSLGPRS